MLLATLLVKIFYAEKKHQQDADALNLLDSIWSVVTICDHLKSRNRWSDAVLDDPD